MNRPLIDFSEARCSLNELLVNTDVTVTEEQVAQLAPLIANSNLTARTLARNDISDEDLTRLLWIEVSLRNPKARPEIVRRLIGRIHTRQRRRVMSVVLSPAGQQFVDDCI